VSTRHSNRASSPLTDRHSQTNATDMSRSPAPQPKPRANRFRWFWLLFSLLGVATISATTGALLAVSLSSPSLSQRELSKEEKAVFGNNQPISSLGLQLPQLTRPVNILVLGIKVITSDVDDSLSRKYGYHALVNSFEGLSDTMFLVRFDPSQKKLSVLSIPRDTRAWVDGLGMTKINAANSRGGPALSAKAVSELLGGVPIDRYMRINVQGVEKLLDALGGLTVYVPRDMKYQDDSQHLYINLKQGRQHLNGEQALAFLRFRHDEYGDIGRVQRQQMAMRSLKEQALNPTTLLKLPDILSVIRENLDTNLSMEEIVALAGFATQVDRQNVQMLVTPGDYGDIARYGTSYWLPYPNQIRDMMAKHFEHGVGSGDSRSMSQVRVAVQDASGNPEAARAVARQLEAMGYRQTFVARSWKETISTTRVIAQNGDADTAEQVKAAIGRGDVRVDSSGILGSDVTIQIGSDWQGTGSNANP